MGFWVWQCYVDLVGPFFLELKVRKFDIKIVFENINIYMYLSFGLLGMTRFLMFSLGLAGHTFDLMAYLFIGIGIWGLITGFIFLIFAWSSMLTMRSYATIKPFLQQKSWRIAFFVIDLLLLVMMLICRIIDHFLDMPILPTISDGKKQNEKE